MPTSDFPADRNNAIGNIYNYYEQLVLDEIRRQLGGESRSDDFIADAACVALNQLPARYIRHAVDMAFYLSPRESQNIERRVATAVKVALQFLSQNSQRAEA